MQAEQILADYERWLGRQALAARTRSSYRRWVRELVAHLADGGELDAFLAVDGEDDRRAVLGDWRRRLVDRGLAPSTVNLALAAATSLLDARALPAPRVPRVEVDPPPARALSREQLHAVERESDRLGSSRDRAIMVLLLRTGLRIGEVSELDASDVRLTQRTGELVVRHGKGDRRRIVPLSRSARTALRAWRIDRERHPSNPARDEGPLWLSRAGRRLSVRSIGKLVAGVMAAAGVEESAHGLRHTVATQLVREHRRDLTVWISRGRCSVPARIRRRRVHGVQPDPVRGGARNRRRHRQRAPRTAERRRLRSVAPDAERRAGALLALTCLADSKLIQTHQRVDRD